MNLTLRVSAMVCGLTIVPRVESWVMMLLLRGEMGVHICEGCSSTDMGSSWSESLLCRSVSGCMVLHPSESLSTYMDSSASS